MAEVFFNGPAGRIEGQYTTSSKPNAPVALVLHPHPQHGGTLDNKIVFKMYKALAKNDYTVLRINFRGVGKSQGEFDRGIGELTDAASALDWLQLQNPENSGHLVAGFSFGAWIAMQLIMRRPEVEKFIVTAPPVNKYDFSFLTPCPCPGLIVQGDQDSIVLESAVHDFAQKLAKNKKTEYQLIRGADHFFRHKEKELETVINNYLASSNTESRTSNNSPPKSSSKKIYLS